MHSESFLYSVGNLSNEADYMTPNAGLSVLLTKSFKEKSQHLKTLTDQNLDELVCYVHDKDIDIRIQALKLLSKYGKSEFLILNLFHESDLVRKAVARECVFHNFVAELIVLSNDNSFEVAKVGVQGLIYLKKVFELFEILEKTRSTYLRAYILDKLEFTSFI